MEIKNLIIEGILKSNSVGELESILEILLKYHSFDNEGNVYSIRALVDNVKGLKIIIYPNDHTPAHFHVVTCNINASFTICDCTLIKGRVGKREKRIMQWWHENSKQKLIEFWNNTRPDSRAIDKMK